MKKIPLIECLKAMTLRSKLMKKPKRLKSNLRIRKTQNLGLTPSNINPWQRKNLLNRPRWQTVKMKMSTLSRMMTHLWTDIQTATLHRTGPSHRDQNPGYLRTWPMRKRTLTMKRMRILILQRDLWKSLTITAWGQLEVAPRELKGAAEISSKRRISLSENIIRWIRCTKSRLRSIRLW